MTTTASFSGVGRRRRRALALLGVLALTAAACGDDSDSGTRTDTEDGSAESEGPADAEGSEGSVDAADLILGAPADCLENPFCVPGVLDVYGVDLEGNFVPLEAGSVVDSLKADAIDIGVLFSTDAVLTDPDLVVLEDDQGMSAADNILPVATQELDDAYGDDLATVVNEVTAALTTDDVTAMNARYEVDNEDAEVVAADWLEDQGLADGDDGEQDGPAISIGAQDFSESIVLAEVYQQALEANGFEVSTQSVGGFRDILFGSFESDDINLAVDYLASETDFLADDAVATSDADETLGLLEPLLEDRDMVAYEPADVVNVNVFVMTSDRADELGISSLSDLG